MTIAGIGSSVSVYAARNTAHERSSVADMISSAGLPQTDFARLPAAIVDISEPAKQMALDSLRLKSGEGSGSVIAPPDDFIVPGMTGDNEETLDGVDDSATLINIDTQESSIRYSFKPGSPEDIMNSQLEDKSINSSAVTNELSNMLRQTATNKDARLETRVENRESALKCAEYIADKYLNAGERKKFMSAVEKLYTEDVKTDKGYYELIPDDWMEALPSEKRDVSDYLVMGYTAKFLDERGLESLVELKTDSELWDDYSRGLSDFLSNAARDDREAAERMGKRLVLERETIVDKATKNARFNFNDALYDKNMLRLRRIFNPQTN